eukprot:TRINITY_DN9017_c0_g1_i1.p1 TRINITY_DN9017_c0_g1~~TRINITY_DN9017_c0_g1_i1.p1  ORF type:complete len:142 (+),score=23.19 TRINITY_DN9017_c0_g1_i1:29-454(+)
MILIFTIFFLVYYNFFYGRLYVMLVFFFFFFQAEDGIRDAQESRGLGDVYKRQVSSTATVRPWTASSTSPSVQPHEVTLIQHTKQKRNISKGWNSIASLTRNAQPPALLTIHDGKRVGQRTESYTQLTKLMPLILGMNCGF